MVVCPCVRGLETKGRREPGRRGPNEVPTRSEEVPKLFSGTCERRVSARHASRLSRTCFNTLRCWKRRWGLAGGSLTTAPTLAPTTRSTSSLVTTDDTLLPDSKLRHANVELCCPPQTTSKCQLTTLPVHETAHGARSLQRTSSRLLRPLRNRISLLVHNRTCDAWTVK